MLAHARDGHRRRECDATRVSCNGMALAMVLVVMWRVAPVRAQVTPISRGRSASPAGSDARRSRLVTLFDLCSRRDSVHGFRADNRRKPAFRLLSVFLLVALGYTTFWYDRATTAVRQVAELQTAQEHIGQAAAGAAQISTE